jgi:dipeptide transport system permease protein
MGLDQPLPVQYADYVGKLLQGDLGQSLVSREPVSKEFAALFPATVELAPRRSSSRWLGLLLGVSAGPGAARCWTRA